MEKIAGSKKKRVRGKVSQFPLPTFERAEETFDSGRDVICFSHLRWDFVYQRPQHLLSRFAREGRVFFVEEPIYGEEPYARLSMKIDKSGVCVVVPLLPAGTTPTDAMNMQRDLLQRMYTKCAIRDCIAWYYTPMAWPFTSHLAACVIVYDCMDELSLFRGAPNELRRYEAELMEAADVVFTGGLSLYEVKRSLHPNVHAMPSSIDVAHFKRARSAGPEPPGLQGIPRPRLVFAGVIDERLDLDLLSSVAASRPAWHFVLVGPIVKIDPGTLPTFPNVHYLGQRPYDDLPLYLGHCDVALMPFAKNDATRYISPTKTPEYLAAGRPVISTSIRDVVATYQASGLVEICDTPKAFADAIGQSLDRIADPKSYQEWLQRADTFLAEMSWDRTWMSMATIIEKVITSRESSHATAS